MSTAYEDICVVKAAGKASVSIRDTGLFTGEDKNLPTLTQVYRLATPEQQKEFYIITSGMAESLRSDEPPRNIFALLGKRDLDEQVRRFGELCTFAQSLIENIGEKLGPTRGQLEELAKWQKQVGRHLKGAGIGMPDEHLLPGQITESVTNHEDFQANTVVVETIIRHLVEMVGYYRKGDEIVKKCPECNNWYVIPNANSNRKLCSRRCTVRLGERRRRAEKKIKNPQKHDT